MPTYLKAYTDVERANLEPSSALRADGGNQASAVFVSSSKAQTRCSAPPVAEVPVLCENVGCSHFRQLRGADDRVFRPGPDFHGLGPVLRSLQMQ